MSSFQWSVISFQPENVFSISRRGTAIGPGAALSVERTDLPHRWHGRPARVFLGIHLGETPMPRDMISVHSPHGVIQPPPSLPRLGLRHRRCDPSVRANRCQRFAVASRASYSTKAGSQQTSVRTSFVNSRGLKGFPMSAEICSSRTSILSDNS